MNECRRIAKEKSIEQKIIGEYDKEKEDAILHEMDKYAMKQEGFKQGIEQGDKQGFERGTLQGSREEKIRIAKKMLKNNIDIKIISECTLLSIQELEKLK